MLEVIMVLLITGIVAGIAYPKIDVGRYKADSVVTVVRSAMQQAQRASLVGQHDVIVSFDITGNKVRVVWDKNNDHAAGTGERVTWTSLSSGNKFAVPSKGVKGNILLQPVVGPSVKTIDGMPSVTFHRDGSLSSELEVYMSTIASPIRWRAVTVVQATGRTDWFRQQTAGTNWVAGVL
jgi:hypothetical protein